MPDHAGCIWGTATAGEEELRDLLAIESIYGAAGILFTFDRDKPNRSASMAWVRSPFA
jgi:hypothetical protein